MSIIAQTPSLQIRQFSADEEPLMIAMNTDERLIRYTPKRTVEEISKIFQQQLKDYETQPQFGRWAIVNVADNSVIGNCMLIPARPGLTGIELGYMLNYDYWGKGIATEVVCALVDYAFNQLGLTEVCAITAPENTASQRVLIKAGFTYAREVLVLENQLPLFIITKSDD